MTFPCVFRFLTQKTSIFDDFSLCFYVSYQKDINFSWLFLVFLGFWQKTQGKVIERWKNLVSFGLNFEDEGAIGVSFWLCSSFSVAKSLKRLVRLWNQYICTIHTSLHYLLIQLLIEYDGWLVFLFFFSVVSECDHPPLKATDL